MIQFHIFMLCSLFLGAKMTAVAPFPINCSLVVQENLPRGSVLTLPLALSSKFNVQVVNSNSYFGVIRDDSMNFGSQMWRDRVWYPKENPKSESDWLLIAMQHINREQICQTEPSCDCRYGNSHPDNVDSSKQRCQVSLRLVAIAEGAASQLPSVLDLNICISDENDEPPIFLVEPNQNELSSYQGTSWSTTTSKMQVPVMNVHLKENLELGSLVLIPAATDRDVFPDHTITSYNLKCPPPTTNKNLHGFSPYDAPFSLVYDLNTEIQSLSLRVDKILKLDVANKNNWPLLCSVTASDGVHTGSMQLKIFVDDVNDNAPLWATPTVLNSEVKIVEENLALGEWVIEVPESISPFSVLLQLKGKDADPAFGKLSFVLKKSNPSSNQMFYIDSRTGEIRLVGKLDFEDVKSNEVLLSVIVKDNGGLETPGNLTFKVRDVNDNRPVIRFASQTSSGELNEFTKKTGGLEIVENSQQSVYIDYITVNDADSEEFGRVSCKLKAGTIADHFKLTQIGNNLWALLAIKPIDREALIPAAASNMNNRYFTPTKRSGSRFGITVSCNDNPDAFKDYQLFSEQSIQINILDVNDNPPKFTGITLSNEMVIEASISEGLPPGTPVHQVIAEDPDVGDSLTFAIVQLSTTSKGSSWIPANERLAIDSASGLITTQCVFDREREASITDFGVMVFDGTRQLRNDGAVNHTILARLELRILDSNDNSPVFNSPTVIVVPEDKPVDSQLTKLNVTDPDEGDNGTVVLFFSQHLLMNPFTLYPDGRLFLSKTLDRERNDHYELIIYAADKGKPTALTSTVTFIVQVEDVNDSPPKFELPAENMLKTVPCTQTYIALDIIASDADSLPGNTQIKYRIVAVKGPFGDSKWLTNSKLYNESDLERLFYIQSDTGALFLHAPGVEDGKVLTDPCEATGIYRLIVMAFDPSKPELNSTTTVTVHITRDAYIIDKIVDMKNNGNNTTSLLPMNPPVEVVFEDNNRDFSPPQHYLHANEPNIILEDDRFPLRSSRMAFLGILLLIAVFVGLTLLLIVLVYFVKRRNRSPISSLQSRPHDISRYLPGMNIRPVDKDASYTLQKGNMFNGNMVILPESIYGSTRPQGDNGNFKTDACDNTLNYRSIGNLQAARETSSPSSNNGTWNILLSMPSSSIENTIATVSRSRNTSLASKLTGIFSAPKIIKDSSSIGINQVRVNETASSYDWMTHPGSPVPPQSPVLLIPNRAEECRSPNQSSQSPPSLSIIDDKMEMRQRRQLYTDDSTTTSNGTYYVINIDKTPLTPLCYPYNNNNNSNTYTTLPDLAPSVNSAGQRQRAVKFVAQQSIPTQFQPTDTSFV